MNSTCCRLCIFWSVATGTFMTLFQQISSSVSVLTAFSSPLFYMAVICCNRFLPVILSTIFFSHSSGTEHVISICCCTSELYQDRLFLFALTETSSFAVQLIYLFTSKSTLPQLLSFSCHIYYCPMFMLLPLHPLDVPFV